MSKKQKTRRILKLVYVISSMSLLFSTPAMAMSSANYQVIDSFVGNGGVVNGSSAHYESVTTNGSDIGGNESSGNAYQINSGAISSKDPNLSFGVSTGSISLGTLHTNSTATATAAFTVLNYTSYGYTVSLLGNPPSSGSHTLAKISVGSANNSSAGTEQYGINLEADTSPSISGSAAPQQIPSSSFSNGNAVGNYAVSNEFQYNSGDTIAQATQSSGQTSYTVSYIANISSTTPSGSYSGVETFLCTATY
ncbi:MAG TPA: hypothetical protein VGS28_02545 [Candidatus Saccharimonadales bacterium]|nr:hypothetical protein [Candidatus Saccharimonadales bacterium]